MSILAMRRSVVVASFRVSTASRALAPGIALTVALAALASSVSNAIGGPAMVYALAFGFAARVAKPMHNMARGIRFSAQTLLRLGVGLLGASVSLHQLAALGAPVISLAVCAVVFTLALGVVAARALRLPLELGVLLGGAVAICGASAALAIASVLPKRHDTAQHDTLESHTLVAVIGVTALSTLAMLCYPVVCLALGMSDKSAGVFLGASIHDVAQVVGAGYAISDDAGRTATIVKLIRVACLLPIVAAISVVMRKRGSDSSAAPRSVLHVLPWFLCVFVALCCAASVNALSPYVTAFLASTAKFLLVTAMVALGAKTSFSDLRCVGVKPIAVLLIATLGLACAVLAALPFVVR